MHKHGLENMRAHHDFKLSFLIPLLWKYLKCAPENVQKICNYMTKLCVFIWQITQKMDSILLIFSNIKLRIMINAYAIQKFGVCMEARIAMKVEYDNIDVLNTS